MRYTLLKPGTRYWGINSAELRGSGMRRILKHPKSMIQLPVHVMATKMEC